MKPSKPNNITLTHILRPRIAVMVVLLWFGMSTAVSAVHPTAASIDSILQCIDEAISASDQYVQKKKERIAYLKSRANQAETLSAKYELTYQLYAEYLPFVNDSAIYYLERCSDIALQMGDDSKAGGCLSLTALCCSNAGMYVESEAILKTINPEKLHGIDLGLYYYASGHISGELAYYGKFENMRRQYAETSTNYFLLAQKYLPNGTCGVVTFGGQGGRKAAETFMAGLKLASIATHVADAKTCVLHPASSTHRQMSDAELMAAGVSPDLIRLSVGIEDVKAILAALEQALEQV